jgi:hypothetical protein
VIDDRGRLFGKVNLIDAAVGVFVLLLIPLAYGAFLLFRVPAPTIESLQPATVADHTPVAMTIRGQNLRPYLRARVGPMAAEFFLQSPTLAEIKVPALPAGTYDLELYDESNRILLKTAALTVGVASTMKLEAVGSFVGLSKDAAALIDVGTRFPSRNGSAPAVAEVLALRPPELAMRRVKIGPATFAAAAVGPSLVPAILRINCAVGGDVCTLDVTALAEGATIALPLAAGAAGSNGPDRLQFVINQIFPVGFHAAFPAVVTARIRFVAEAELARMVKVGDVDVSAALSTDGTRSVTLDSNRAVLTAVGRDTPTTNAQIVVDSPFRRSPQLTSSGLEPPAADDSHRRGVQYQHPMVVFTCTVRIPAVFTPSGWSYNAQPVKGGALFNFESVSGTLIGTILDVKVEPENAGTSR